MNYHLAEINIARMKGVNIDDPIMQEFVDNLDVINGLAESSPGFVWRLKDESDNATDINPYNDEQVIVNVSVWEDIESLKQFTYHSHHTDFMKRRKEWFHHYGNHYYAMWWLPESEVPSLEEAVARLTHLQEHGLSDHAFTFKKLFSQPTES
ncbi:MAG: DUF3291 domain-containing protein [Bacteroidota bacterium]